MRSIATDDKKSKVWAENNPFRGKEISLNSFIIKTENLYTNRKLNTKYIKMKNLGFDPIEIQKLKDECAEENLSFVFVEDEEEDDEGYGLDFVEVQFVGTFEGKEVIYDAIFSTLRMHHEGLVYDEAEKRAIKAYPNYKPIEERGHNYKANDKLDEEVEHLIMEFMDEITEEDSIKVKESIVYDKDYEFGIGIEVNLNVEEFSVEIISEFVEKFNAGTLKLDETEYSFTFDEDEEEED